VTALKTPPPARILARDRQCLAKPDSGALAPRRGRWPGGDHELVAMSLWLGLRYRDARWMRAVNIALALIALPLAIHLATRDATPSAEHAARVHTRSTSVARRPANAGTIADAAPAAAPVIRPGPALPQGQTTPPVGRTTPAATVPRPATGGAGA
jgi:hypothetical protein